MAVNEFTKNMMAKFPSWMKMAKDPDSVGAQFLNVFGFTLSEFQEQLDETINNFYIETAHTDIIDILYKIPLTTVTVSDTEDEDEVFIEHHDGQQQMVLKSKNLRVFYERKTNLPRYFIDRSSGYLYLRLDLDLIEDLDYPFQSLIVNEAKHYNLEVHHVWNVFDEFGLLLGLNRLPRERNEQFKKRILDVFEHPGTSTSEGVRNGLARELGLSREEVEVVPFHESAFGTELIKPDGTPTETMVRYAKQINEQLKFTWDTLNLGEAYWFSLEQDNLGIDYLPHIWDVDTSLFERDEFQSGVGFGNDLLVTPPSKEESVRHFKAYVSLIGYYEQTEEFFPEIAFQYKIYAKGKKLEETYQEEAFKYTVSATEVFDQSYRLVGSQDFPYTMRTEFYEKNNFLALPDREKIKFGKSNDFLHTQTDSIMKLIANMATADDSQSNWIPSLDIIWEDSAGEEHSFPFKTKDDFLIPRNDKAGDPLTSLAFADVAYEEDGRGLGLGYGAFQKDIDTTVEWQQGQYRTDVVLIKNGEVTLNLDRMKRLMN